MTIRRAEINGERKMRQAVGKIGCGSKQEGSATEQRGESVEKGDGARWKKIWEG